MAMERFRPNIIMHHGQRTRTFLCPIPNRLVHNAGCIIDITGRRTRPQIPNVAQKLNRWPCVYHLRSSRPRPPLSDFHSHFNHSFVTRSDHNGKWDLYFMPLVGGSVTESGSLVIKMFHSMYNNSCLLIILVMHFLFLCPR